MNQENKYSYIINDYKRNYSSNPDRWILYSKNQKSLAEAIRVATLSIDTYGKRHPHQYRRSQTTLNVWYDSVLCRKRKIQKVQSFQDLIEFLQSIIVKEIGDLTVYDTATRIGAFLQLYPDRIYLHAGTKEGARN